MPGLVKKKRHREKRRERGYVKRRCCHPADKQKRRNVQRQETRERMQSDQAKENEQSQKKKYKK